MQASSCNFTNFIMQSKRQFIVPNRHIGTNGKSVESFKGSWDSIKRKKINTTDWTSTAGNQGGRLSDTCVFTRARLTRHALLGGGIESTSPRRASNHRYGPDQSLATRGAIGRQYLVSRRPTSAHRFAGSVSSSG